jgi:hypothetical protein
MQLCSKLSKINVNTNVVWVLGLSNYSGPVSTNFQRTSFKGRKKKTKLNWELQFYISN